MNFFKTTDNGGLPFVLDDLRWEADAVRESFFGIVTSWGLTASDSYILNGCDLVINGSNYDVSAGYIVLEGEVYKVDAHSVVITAPIGETHIWQVIETNDPAGTKTFDAGGTFETYKIRRAQIVTSLSSGLSAVPKAATIHEKIAIFSEPYIGVWNEELIPNANTKTTQITNAWTTTGADIMRWKLVNKTLTVNFKLTAGNVSTGIVPGFAIKLPNNYICTNQFFGAGNFRNTDTPVESATDTANTACNIRTAGSTNFGIPGDSLVITPAREGYVNFNGTGNNNITVEGQITIEID